MTSANVRCVWRGGGSGGVDARAMWRGLPQAGCGKGERLSCCCCGWPGDASVPEPLGDATPRIPLEVLRGLPMPTTPAEPSAGSVTMVVFCASEGLSPCVGTSGFLCRGVVSHRERSDRAAGAAGAHPGAGVFAGANGHGEFVAATIKWKVNELNLRSCVFTGEKETP